MTSGDEPHGTAAELDLEQQLAVYQREYPEVDPQVERVVSALSRVSRRLDVVYGRHIAELGISNAEWEVLRTLVLEGRPYRLGPGELAKRLGLTPAAMTHRIDRMVTEGLVTRERDESNRVRVIVELTPDGRGRWLDAMRKASVFEADILQDLGSDQLGTLAEMLSCVLGRLDPDAS
jgi:DNA-binding MarR family transcriptional regulator